MHLHHLMRSNSTSRLCTIFCTTTAVVTYTLMVRMHRLHSPHPSIGSLLPWTWNSMQNLWQPLWSETQALQADIWEYEPGQVNNCPWQTQSKNVCTVPTIWHQAQQCPKHCYARCQIHRKVLTFGIEFIPEVVLEDRLDWLGFQIVGPAKGC